MLKKWIEAIRLHTLPVSIAGVLGGVAVCIAYHCFSWLPALLCLLFAISAQITSNLANEYFDYKNGIDKPGRDGFRRGLTEGDITPGAMRKALLTALGLSALFGLSLTIWGGAWLIIAGIIILLGALAYSGGPYPLSQHGLGDLAVVIFYGIVPVFFTAVLQANSLEVNWTASVTGFETPLWSAALTFGLAIGIMGCNVLIVNNYRDADDDRKVGKNTTVVIFGRPFMRLVYLICWLAADLLIALTIYQGVGLIFWIGLAIFVCWQIRLWMLLGTWSGAALNQLLKFTALTILGEILFILFCI